jgi:hypothetical protein
MVTIFGTMIVSSQLTSKVRNSAVRKSNKQVWFNNNSAALYLMYEMECSDMNNIGGNYV